MHINSLLPLSVTDLSSQAACCCWLAVITILDAANCLKWEQIRAQLWLPLPCAQGCVYSRRGGLAAPELLLLLTPKGLLEGGQGAELGNGASTASFELPSKAVREQHQEGTPLSPGVLWVPLGVPRAPSCPSWHWHRAQVSSPMLLVRSVSGMAP